MSTFDLAGVDDASLRVFKGSTTIDVPDGWTVEDATVGDATPFYANVEVAYRLPDGTLDTKSLILRRPAAVLLAVLTEPGQDRRIMVVRQTRHGAGHTMLELPGGMQEEGESLRDAAAREFSQEAGYEVDPSVLELLLKLHRDPARSPGLDAEVFVAEITEFLEQGSPFVERGEHIEGRSWARLNDVYKELTESDNPVDAVLFAALSRYILKTWK